MRLLIVLLLSTSFLFAQEVTTTRTGGYFFSECSDGFKTQNRSVFRLASNDAENHVIKNRGVTCKVISPEHTVKATGFDNVVVQAKQIDTTFFATQANKIFDKITNARYFSIVYRPDSTKRHVNILSIVAKDSLPKPLDCQECGTKPIKIRFKAKEIDGNIFDAKEIEHEYIVKDSVIETTLVLSDLRIEETVKGVKIRVVGNEVNQMYFKFRESGTTEWFETIRETSYKYDSHGIFETRLVKGKTYDLQAIGTDINGVEVIEQMFNFEYL